MVLLLVRDQRLTSTSADWRKLVAFNSAKKPVSNLKPWHGTGNLSVSRTGCY